MDRLNSTISMHVLDGCNGVVAEGAGSTLTLSTASNFEQVANYSASYPQWDGK